MEAALHRHDAIELLSVGLTGEDLILRAVVVVDAAVLAVLLVILEELGKVLPHGEALLLDLLVAALDLGDVFRVLFLSTLVALAVSVAALLTQMVEDAPQLG